jgi:hypothetical protein
MHESENGPKIDLSCGRRDACFKDEAGGMYILPRRRGRKS